MKSATALARLTKVDLRSVFPSESADFTPWLAQEENLSQLGDEIGIALELEAQEQDVGPFRADILCKDTATENWVLIENQIERTDHTHLGQLLTYAAGLHAVTIVWIADRFTDEHRAALDWLNEHTDSNINFFGVEIELYRIGESPVAPRFNIVSQPNEWSRTVQAATSQGAAKTELRQTQLRFWMGFADFMEKESKVRCQKPKPERQMSHPIGRSGIYLRSVISSWDSVEQKTDSEMRVELIIEGIDAKRRFAALEQRRTDIERVCGVPLTWFNQPDVGRCRIYTRKKADFMNEQLWPEQFGWLKNNLELFLKVFKPELQRTDTVETDNSQG